jgi:hypothetical protein
VPAQHAKKTAKGEWQMDEAFGRLLDMLPFLSLFGLVLLVLAAPKGDGNRWGRFSSDPRRQNKDFINQWRGRGEE